MLFREKLSKMREVSKLVAVLLQELKSLSKPGVRTIELDDYAAKFIEKNNCGAPCLNYKSHFANKPYPARICTSPNYTICHGIPGEYILKDGDILSIDIVLSKNGLNGDSCITFPIGNVKQEHQFLMEYTEKAMYKGIEAVKIDGKINDIGFAIENYVKNIEKETGIKYGIVDKYGGHGIGEEIHEEPFVSNVINNETCPIKPGLFFTIEPMLNLGVKNTRTLNDGWTVITQDYKYSAHFEHTLAITENGVEILTKI